jgi:hypothetical protein
MLVCDTAAFLRRICLLEVKLQKGDDGGYGHPYLGGMQSIAVQVRLKTTCLDVLAILLGPVL